MTDFYNSQLSRERELYHNGDSNSKHTINNLSISHADQSTHSQF